MYLERKCKLNKTVLVIQSINYVNPTWFNVFGYLVSQNDERVLEEYENI